MMDAEREAIEKELTQIIWSAIYEPCDEEWLSEKLFALMKRAEQRGREEMCPHKGRDVIGGDCAVCAEIVAEGGRQFKRGLLRGAEIAESMGKQENIRLACGYKIAEAIRKEVNKEL